MSFFQFFLNYHIDDKEYLPDALGVFYGIEGLHEFTAEEMLFVNDLISLLEEPTLVNLIVLLPALVDIDIGTLLPIWPILIPNFEWDLSVVEPVLTKLVESHGFDSIYYGLMHGAGWNVYNVPTSEGQGGPQ